MFDIRRYNDSCINEWNDFVKQSKNGTFLFDRRYMDYHRDRFEDYSIMFYKENKLYALLPANLRENVLYSHQGLTYGGLVMNELTTASEVLHLFEELNVFLKENDINRVVYKPVPHIYHTIPSEEDLYALFVVCKASLIARDISSCIDLHDPLKWRRDRHYGANKAKTNGITVERSNDLSAFHKVLDDNLMGKYGVHPVHSLSEIQLLKNNFPDNIVHYVAKKDGEVIGGTVLYVCGQTVHAQYISATAEGKHLHAIDAIYRRILCEDYSEGYKYFDFGKSTEDGGLYLNETLIAQKEGFGGRGICYDTYEWKV